MNTKVKRFLRTPGVFCTTLALVMFVGSLGLRAVGVYENPHLLAIQTWALVFGFALLLGGFMLAVLPAKPASE